MKFKIKNQKRITDVYGILFTSFKIKPKSFGEYELTFSFTDLEKNEEYKSTILLSLCYLEDTIYISNFKFKGNNISFAIEIDFENEISLL